MWISCAKGSHLSVTNVFSSLLLDTHCYRSHHLSLFMALNGQATDCCYSRLHWIPSSFFSFSLIFVLIFNVFIFSSCHFTQSSCFASTFLHCWALILNILKLKSWKVKDSIFWCRCSNVYPYLCCYGPVPHFFNIRTWEYNGALWWIELRACQGIIVLLNKKLQSD